MNKIVNTILFGGQRSEVRLEEIGEVANFFNMNFHLISYHQVPIL